MQSPAIHPASTVLLILNLGFFLLSTTLSETLDETIMDCWNRHLPDYIAPAENSNGMTSPARYFPDFDMQQVVEELVQANPPDRNVDFENVTCRPL